MSGIWDVLTVALIGCVSSLVLTALALVAARRFRVLDHPEGYKGHADPTPLLGGLGVAGGLVMGTLWMPFVGIELDVAGLAAVGLGTLVVLVAGLIDDARGLRVRHKFAWQLGATASAGLTLALLGVRLELFLGWELIPIVLLTVLWIVGVTNALNFIDNMNGLCAGVGAVAACSLAAYNLRSGELTVALAAAALGGACIGFLPYNWPRARIFLGDAGSMTIGFALASISVMGVYTPGAQLPVLAVLAPVFILAIPILDAGFVIALRLRAGHPPWVGDRRHISHRLVRRGMAPTAAVAALWVASAACGIAALLLPTVGPSEAPLLIALLACALGALAAVAGSQGLP